ncbi:unnamed protein product [Peniophora sp. CBMAI 1063]|nr:unnamed protein product [Peniophora sp. CBMAI 1063]
MDENIEIAIALVEVAIARAQMEAAEKRLAHLSARQGSSVSNAPTGVGKPTTATSEIGLGSAGYEDALTLEGLGAAIAEKRGNAQPPVITPDDDSIQAPDGSQCSADTGLNDDFAPGSTASDEYDELADVVGDDHEPAETITALRNDGVEERMPVGVFIDRVFRWGGLVWSDSQTRQGVDVEAARQMATEMVGFEVITDDQVRSLHLPPAPLTGLKVGQRAPLEIKSACQWVSESRLATKVYTSVAESNYSALVAQAWCAIRQLPYNEVLKMNGRYGLIGIIRAIYQANAIDPEAREDFRMMMLDAAEALRAMRETIWAARSAELVPASAPITAPPGTLLDVLMQRDTYQTVRTSEAIKRFVSGDVIEIDDDDDDELHDQKKRGKGKDGEMKPAIPAKRKSTGTTKPSLKKSKLV